MLHTATVLDGFHQTKRKLLTERSTQKLQTDNWYCFWTSNAYSLCLHTWSQNPDLKYIYISVKISLTLSSDFNIRQLLCTLNILGLSHREK